MQIETTRPSTQTLATRSKLPAQIGYGVLYIMLTIVAVIQIFPLLWLMLFSLKTYLTSKLLKFLRTLHCMHEVQEGSRDEEL